MDAFLVGATVRINRVDYLVASVVPVGGGYPSGSMTLTAMNGSAVTFPGNFAGDVWITSLAPSAALTNVPVRVHNFHGIEFRTKVDIDRMQVTGFAGYGMFADSNQSLGYYGAEPNVNSSQISKSQITANVGGGLYLRGVNSNIINVTGNDFFSSAGWGVYDISQHGNAYSGNHYANNLNPIFTGGAINRSTFSGEYAEGGNTSILAPKNTWFGGTSGGSAFDKEFSKGAVIATGETNVSGTAHLNGIKTFGQKPSDIPGGIGTAITSVQIGQGSNPEYPVLMGFGNSHESGGLDSPDSSYFLTYAETGNPAPYWYALQHGAAARGGRSAFAFSGALASEGANQFWLENGLYFGRTSGGLTRAKLFTDSSGAVIDKNLKLPTLQIESAGGAGLAATAANLGKFRLVPGGGTKQVETLTVLTSATGYGDVHLDIASSKFATVGPLFDFVVNDTPTQQAAKIRALLNANSTVTTYYVVGGTGASVTLTAITESADDTALNMFYRAGTSNPPAGGVTAVNSANTTPGVASSSDDTVQILIKLAAGGFAWRNVTLTTP
jgi:hypothetical protein